jgi:hypothetical protein
VALVTALLALVLVSLPSRVSVARQTGGDLNGDVVTRVTEARNVEFVGRGHGAPPDVAALQADPGSGPRVGLGDYLLGDHSATVLVGGVLSGAYDGLSASSERPDSGLLGLVAFIFEVAGVVFLMFVRGWRLFALIPAMLAFVPWFFADRAGAVPFDAQAAFWPALLVGAAVLSYALRQALAQRTAARSLVPGMRLRAAALRPRRRSRAQAAKP